MLSVPSFANSPTALTLPPSVLAVTAPDLVSTRVTPAALPAPLSDLQVQNDGQGSTAPATPAETQNAAAGSPFTASGVSGALTGNLTASGPSATFLAQAFAQTDNAVSLAISYAQFLPAPQYDTLVGYSFVKYQPSDAGIPSQLLPLEPFTEDTTAPANEYQAYSTTQSRNASNLSSASPQMIVAG